MEEDRLQKEFEWVRDLFFPRWDQKRRWRVKLAPDLHGALGCCEPKRRTIYLAFIPTSDKGRAILIHEICHAVTNGCHGAKWQARMEKAIKRAEKLGLKNLALALAEDLNNPIGPRSQTVYNQIRDAARDFPDGTFWQIVDYVRQSYAMSRREFLRRFPKARTAYSEGKQEGMMLKAHRTVKWGKNGDTCHLCRRI